MGGKPNPGTKKDKRLKKNRKKKKTATQSITRKRRRAPFFSTRSADGRFPI